MSKTKVTILGAGSPSTGSGTRTGDIRYKTQSKFAPTVEPHANLTDYATSALQHFNTSTL